MAKCIGDELRCGVVLFARVVVNVERCFCVGVVSLDSTSGCSKLRASPDATTIIAACSEQTLVMFYLENADQKRFGSLKDNLMNQYISGNDSYPTTLVQAENLLTNYQDSMKKTLTYVVANIDSGRELSMVQSNKKKKDRKAR